MHPPVQRAFRTLFLRLLAVVVLAACGAPSETPRDAASSLDEVPADLAERSQAYRGLSVPMLGQDAQAMRLAGQLFALRCAGCHGGNPEARGAPDLAQGHFNFGATEASIRTTIHDGRMLAMPAMGSQFGETNLGQLVAFVQSLGSGKQTLSSFEEGGEVLFADHCAVCHGAAGAGNIELGAPNLADDYWQNGGSMMNIRLAITRGIEAQCPAQGGALSDAEIDLLTAYVLSAIDSQRNGS